MPKSPIEEEETTKENESKKDINKSGIASPITLRITPKLFRQGSDIAKKGLELGLTCAVKLGKVLVLGSEDKINDFKTYLIEKEAEPEVGKDNQESNEKKEDEFVQEEIKLSFKIRNQRYPIENKARDLGLFYEFREDKIFVLGPQKSINLLTHFLNGIEQEAAKKEVAFPPNNYPNHYSAQPFNNNLFDNNGLGTNGGMGFPGRNYQYGPEIDIRNIDPKNLEEIKKTAADLGIVAVYTAEKIIPQATDRDVLDGFVIFVEQLKRKRLYKPQTEETNLFMPDVSTNDTNDPEEFVQRKIPLLPAHNLKRDKLKLKAKELSLIYDFDHNSVQVAGTNANVKKFIAAMSEVSSESQRSLYPLYWDFNEKRPFARIKLFKQSIEYQDVARRMLEELGDEIKIIKIERIQNTFLMNKYLDFIQKKLQEAPHQQIDRELLFQEKNDLDFTINREIYYGNYEFYKPRHFSRNASVVADNQEENRRGTFEMILADVFIGNSTDELLDDDKVPYGYDSFFGDEDCTIYNVYQSYPLYLIEYVENVEEDNEEDDY